MLSPGYLEEAVRLAMPELRARREDALAAETGLSYLRRVVQGRLDIVLAECSRRSAGHDRSDLGELVEQLPAILADHVHAPGRGRPPTLLTPGEPDAELAARVEAVLPGERLAGLSEVGDAELRAVAASLESLERSLSAQRRALHAVLDRLQEEVVRRYQCGEASIDGLVQ